MSRKLVIVGAGGLGREVHRYALDSLAAGTAEGYDGFGGFLDDLPDTPDRLRGLGVDFDFVEPIAEHTVRDDLVYVMGIGTTADRRRIVGLIDGSATWGTVVHPTAYVAPSARLGAGVVVAPFAVVSIDTEVGAHTVVNVHCSLGHDCRIGAYGVLSPFVAVSGNAVLEDEVFVGTHATVVPKRTIGRRSQVGAGSVVTRDVEPGSLVIGAPAKGRVMLPCLPVRASKLGVQIGCTQKNSPSRPASSCSQRACRCFTGPRARTP